MTVALIVSGIAYIVGSILGFWMMRTELEAEGDEYTKGDRVIGSALSFLSWLIVIGLLIRAWYIKIGLTGHWSKPVKEKPIVIDIGEATVEAKQKVK